MQVDARLPDRDAQISREYLYSPEHYCGILRAALGPLETDCSAALLVTSRAMPRFPLCGVRNYASSFSAARSTHHKVTNGVAETLPSLCHGLVPD